MPPLALLTATGGRRYHRFVMGRVDFEPEAGAFELRAFLDEFFAKGLIPQSLIRWEMTGLDDEIIRLR